MSETWYICLREANILPKSIKFSRFLSICEWTKRRIKYQSARQRYVSDNKLVGFISRSLLGRSLQTDSYPITEQPDSLIISILFLVFQGHSSIRSMCIFVLAAI